MKTFKEWFDGLSAPTQAFVASRCYWIDTSRDDYIRHLDASDELILDRINKTGRYSNHDVMTELVAALLIQKGDEEGLNIFLNNTKSSNNDLIYFKDKKYITEYYAERFSSRVTEPFEYVLLTIDDFDNPDWSQLDTSNITYNETWKEILGYDFLKEIVKRKPDIVELYRLDVNDDLFDELFFCENGWNENQKLSIIRKYNSDCTAIEDFIKRIASVEKKYLKYLPMILQRYPATAAQLYTQKKSDFECIGKSVKDSFKYSKELRKLFMLAYCCIRKNLPKTKAAMIGDVSSLLKFYSFDFSLIFDSLYPELIEAQPEITE